MESNKKRLLIFSDWFLPGYKAGGPIRSLVNLISCLNNDFEIFLVCGDRDYLDNQPYENVELNTWVKAYGIKLIYLPPANQQINTCSTIVDKLNPNLVYVNGIFSKSFSINPLFALKSSKRKIIVAPRGMLAKGALGIKSFKKKAYLKFAKLAGLYEKVHFHATSEQERVDISKHFPRNEITVIPNIPASDQTNRSEKRAKKAGEIKILSVARIAPEKNVEFALDCLSRIDERLKVEMHIIGAVYDEKYLEKCMDKAESLPDGYKITFAGSKNPDQIRTYYRHAHLFFLPTLGENYGHAIVEALSHNLPVLISDRTPWRDLVEDRLGADYPLANPSDFCRFLETIVQMDQDKYNSYAKGIAHRFYKRVDLKGNISSYKELFNAQG